MSKSKVLVKVHPEGKYVVDLDKDIDVTKVIAGARVALKNDSYTLHLLLPTKVDPLVSLMKVEKVPDSTYDMIGGLDQQIREIKEVRTHCTCATHSTPRTLSYWSLRATHTYRSIKQESSQLVLLAFNLSSHDTAGIVC